MGKAVAKVRIGDADDGRRNRLALLGEIHALGVVDRKVRPMVTAILKRRNQAEKERKEERTKKIKMKIGERHGKQQSNRPDEGKHGL